MHTHKDARATIAWITSSKQVEYFEPKKQAGGHCSAHFGWILKKHAEWLCDIN